MKRLADAGIEMNCQIVCVPEINDGPELQRSMEDLSSLYPSVKSVSVVPVGLTKYRQGLYPVKACGKKEAEAIIDAVDFYGDRCMDKYGSRIFYCGDELYLKAERKLPPYDYYEDFPQFENGVGMLRSLEYEFLTALDALDPAPGYTPPSFSIATGTAAVKLLKNLLQILRNKCYNIKGSVYGIQNDFFGSCVDVAGLVTGGDLIAQLKGKDLGERLLIPASMLRHGGDMFLDNVTAGQVSESLNVV
jgi:NifB/MoaA-like Fe-S oxidoreductase